MSIKRLPKIKCMTNISFLCYTIKHTNGHNYIQEGWSDSKDLQMIFFFNLNHASQTSSNFLLIAQFPYEKQRYFNTTYLNITSYNSAITVT